MSISYFSLSCGAAPMALLSHFHLSSVRLSREPNADGETRWKQGLQRFLTGTMGYNSFYLCLIAR